MSAVYLCSRTTEGLLASAPVKVGEMLDVATSRGASTQELERECDVLAQRAAWLSFYLGSRGASGCGDHGHEAARGFADKQLKRIRRVLGYTHP